MVQGAHTVKHSLDRVEKTLVDGLGAHRQGRLDRARTLYLRAAEILTEVAKESPEPFRTARIQRAEQLLYLAETVWAVGRQKQPASRPQAIPTVDDPHRPGKWHVVKRPTLRLNDVAGLEDAKEQIKLTMVYPFTHPDLAKKYGVAKGGGILLYGPPGTGKTMLAQATAGELDAAFFAVKASDLMSKWFGEAEQNVAGLFAEARGYEKAVIFIDEIEGVVPRRNTTGSSVVPRVVGQFLQELEGFHGQPVDRALLFTGATNEPWMLDEAIMRPGRFDTRIYVPLPDVPARKQILELNLAGRPLHADVNLSDIAARTDGYSGADIRALVREAWRRPFIEAVHTGHERPIDAADFDAAAAEVRPSVSTSTIARFDRWRAEQGR